MTDERTHLTGARHAGLLAHRHSIDEELLHRLTVDAGLPTSSSDTGIAKRILRYIFWYGPAWLTIASFLYTERPYTTTRVAIAVCYHSNTSASTCSPANIEQYHVVSVAECAAAFNSCQVEVDYTGGFFKVGGTMLGIVICVYSFYLLFRSAQNQRLATYLLACGVHYRNDSKKVERLLIIGFAVLVIIYAVGRAYYYENTQAVCTSTPACFCAAPEIIDSPPFTFIAIFLTVVLIWRTTVFAMWESIGNPYTSVPVQQLFSKTARNDTATVMHNLVRIVRDKVKRSNLLRVMALRRKPRFPIIAKMFYTEPKKEDIAAAAPDEIDHPVNLRGNEGAQMRDIINVV